MQKLLRSFDNQMSQKGSDELRSKKVSYSPERAATMVDEIMSMS